ncbi:nucleoside-diphosphate sugar epimerase/dehydratase [Spiribacter sp. 221]|uniref:polysaccharide biosynthesis protein n=1 Tax=Spiribacter onubensis TaxID=3122420 RepID=UPI00349FA84C
MGEWLKGIFDWQRPRKQALMMVADCLLMAVVVWASFALRMGDGLSEKFYQFWYLHLLLPVASIPLFYLAGMYSAVVRYMGPSDVWAVLRGVTLSTLVFIAVVVFGGLVAVPRTTITIYWLMALLLVGGSRFLVRAWHQAARHRRAAEEPVIIYGAGSAGLQLVNSLMSTGDYLPVAFVDDNPRLQGSMIKGVPVYAPARLGRLISQLGAHSILLALPSATMGRRREILADLERYPVHVRTLPSMSDLVSGAARLQDVREVDIEDLLGRDAVPPDPALLGRCVAERSVMVTGAGGSIGSELCRQILAQSPRRLVLLERSELALYRIEQELIALADASGQGVEIVPVLGSVLHRERMRHCLMDNAVETVYHAAAYKHVPLVEANPVEGIRNNGFGTWHAALAAEDAGVRDFVLVSTDKAVRPTSVMGASKRIAEFAVQAVAAHGSPTRFGIVRFGNVLDSSGSVIPLFRRQIREGGPVTVTHPDATRYFMTIPEAASLVMQAGAMAGAGEVFVLEMGSPVRIQDLARRLIQLSGCSVRDESNPKGDVAIEFIGLRPGEKLHEELIQGTEISGTSHPMILQAREAHPDWDGFVEWVTRLDEAFHDQDRERVLALVAQQVPGYCVPGAAPELESAPEWASGPEAGPESAPARSADVVPLRRDGQ